MSTDTRRDKRAKVVSLNVRYKSATIDEFIDNHSYDVSRGGLFVKTSQPFAPGTLLKFEIRIAGDKAVIAGVGRVVWKRDVAQAGPERPAGMGVKFIKVDDASRVTIEKLVGTQPNAGKAYLSEPEAPDSDPMAAKAPFAGVIPPESAPSVSKPPPVPGPRAAPAPAAATSKFGAPDVKATPVNMTAAPAVTASKPPSAQIPVAAKLGTPGPAVAAPPRAGGSVGAIPPHPVGGALPLEKAPSASGLKAAAPAKVAPPARKATIMGLGAVSAPPPASTSNPPSAGPLAPPPAAVPRSSGPASEPRGARALSSPLGGATPSPASVVPRPKQDVDRLPDHIATRPPPPPARVDDDDPFTNLEASPRPKPVADSGTNAVVTSAPMFPSGGGPDETVGTREPTMMKQAAEFLEEALKEAGGSMDEVGSFEPAQGSAGGRAKTTETGTLVMPSAPPRQPEDEALTDSNPELPKLDQLIDDAEDAPKPYTAPATDVAGRSPGVVFGAVPSSSDAIPAPSPSQESLSDLSKAVGPPKKGGAGGAIAFVLVVLLLGGAGLAAWQMGLLGPKPQPPAPTATAPVPSATAPTASVTPSAAPTPASTETAATPSASAAPSTSASVAPSAAVSTAAPATAAPTTPPATARPPQPKPTAKPTAAPVEPTEPSEPAEPKPEPKPKPKPAAEDDNPY